MLINVNPLLSPEILSTLRSMGHGDRLVLSDANFPSYSHNSTLHRMDGLNINQAAKAILSVFPLDSFITEPVLRMEIDGKPDEINEVQQDLINTVKNVSGIVHASRREIPFGIGRIVAILQVVYSAYPPPDNNAHTSFPL